MFFKDKKKNKNNDNLKKIAALLIHTAKIDEDYSIKEEKIIKQTLLKIGANNENIDQIITNFKPPIFWKEKDLVKQQAKIWAEENLNDLIKNTNNLELQIKENPSISILLLTNFIIEKTLKPSN